MSIPPIPGATSCQGCGRPLTHSLVDLGMQPLVNAYLPPDRIGAPEPVYPLHAWVCDSCLLVQVNQVLPPERIFSDYAYFSSYSDSWLAHARDYAETMVARFGLGAGSVIAEIASNDGYLLQYFLERGLDAYGIEPAANVARVAIDRGIPTEIAFFGEATARRLAEAGRAADLLAAKNVLAHVPDVNDFARGVRILLKPDGVFTVEFPHLLNLLREVQFDTIYHEHFTYLSLLAVRTLFERHGLRIFDVETQPTHGGSLRVYAAHEEAGRMPGARVEAILGEEIAAGLDRPEGYDGFEAKVRAVRDGLLAFLARAKAEGRTIAGYGAAAKGNTLFNYCGITQADLPFVVDRNPVKQGKLLPGSHIPVRPVEALAEARPDYVLIIPWNLEGEIVAQMPEVAGWGGRFVTAVPEVKVRDVAG
ncbi:MAG TPA: class I SAM-dependent methyltransferase [Allosphingosinicella sp.]|nr:class I SAM-dependent methyltransferase [Allosphingosinicella sp.]